jgi:hypothetical protein
MLAHLRCPWCPDASSNAVIALRPARRSYVFFYTRSLHGSYCSSRPLSHMLWRDPLAEHGGVLRDIGQDSYVLVRAPLDPQAPDPRVA